MSSLLTITEVEAVGNALGEIKEVCYNDKNGNRICLKIDSQIDTDFFVNQKGNHNKFYEMYQSISDDKLTFYLIVKYGRIGNKAMEYLYSFRSANEFSDFCKKKKWEKISRGYEHIDSFAEYKKITGEIHNE